MPRVVVVGVSDEPVAVAEVASGVEPEDTGDAIQYLLVKIPRA